MKLAIKEEFKGEAAHAISLDMVRDETDRLDTEATLSVAFIHAPGQSAARENYLLSMIHLRDIPGVKPAHIALPGATHELLLFALDPSKNPVWDDIHTWHFLTPHNLSSQLVLPDDEAAYRVFYFAMRGIADGIVWAEPPLSGQKEPWTSFLEYWRQHVVATHPV